MQEADADGRAHARHGRQEHAGCRGPGTGALQSGQAQPAVTLVGHTTEDTTLTGLASGFHLLGQKWIEMEKPVSESKCPVCSICSVSQLILNSLTLNPVDGWTEQVQGY